jgi:hypothetical protein
MPGSLGVFLPFLHAYLQIHEALLFDLLQGL